MKSRCAVVVCAAAALALAGCDGSSSPDAVETTGAAGAGGGGAGAGGAESPAWLLTSAPEGAVGVGEAKKSAAEGDEVAVRGRIGGRMEPMSAGSAVLVIMDPAIQSCADLGEEDHCTTPWDYCCETQESITANNATVQLVDADGAPLAIDLAAHGLKPLDEIVVVGTVAPRPNEQTLIVKATGLYRAGG